MGKIVGSKSYFACNSSGCDAKSPAVQDDASQEAAREIRSAAENAGWQINDNGTSYCPNCRNIITAGIAAVSTIFRF